MSNYILVPIIVALVLAVVVLIYTRVDDGAWFTDPVSVIVALLVSGVVSGIVSSVAYEINIDSTMNYHTTYNLETLQLGGEREGHFFLASGYEKKVLYYYFYVKASDGGLTLHKVGSSGVTLYQSDSTPHMTCRTHKPHIALNENNYDGYIDWCKIYIPKGSIATTFDAGLKDNVG